MRQETISTGGELLITGPAVVRVLVGAARVEVSRANYSHEPTSGRPPVAVYLPGRRERQVKANADRRRKRGRRRAEG